MPKKNPAAVAMGRRRTELMTEEERVEMAQSGGLARAARLSPARRREIALKASAASIAARKKTQSE